MIVRILGEGQFEVPDGDTARLEELDGTLVESVEAGDEAAFRRDLDAALAEVRARGTRLPDGDIHPSSLVFPGEQATLDEVRTLLSEETGAN